MNFFLKWIYIIWRGLLNEENISNNVDFRLWGNRGINWAHIFYSTIFSFFGPQTVATVLHSVVCTHARTPPMILHTPENKWQVIPLVHLKFEFSLIHYKWGSVKTFLRKGIIPKYLHIVEHSTLDRIRYKRCSMFHIRSE